MASPAPPPILSELLGASSPASQVTALRQLKNEVIGHRQKKQMWVRLGILTPLTSILNSFKGEGKRRARDAEFERSIQPIEEARTSAQEARLQAVIVVGSLASGGPAFLPPIHACHAFPPLFALLSPAESFPQIILQTLRTLHNVVDALSLATQEHSASQIGFLDLLYSENTLSNLAELIAQKSASIVTHQQIALICSLISKTCQEDHHRRFLVDSGVLDALAAQLASWVSYTLLQSDLHTALQPSTQLTLGRTRLSSILQALGVIIQHSRPRAQRLLNSSLVGKIFRTMDEQLRASHDKHMANVQVGIRSKVQMPSSCVELLLPTARSSQPRMPNVSSSLGYPPLDAIKTAESLWPRSFSSSVEISSSDGLEHTGVTESPLVAWLIHVSRTFDEITGLMATWLLANLYRLDLVKKDREASIALLVIPSIVRMLDSCAKLSQDSIHPFDNSINSSLGDLVKQEAPAVLAMLTINNPKAQKAAVDAGAIDKLSQLLKNTYDPSIASLSDVWSSEPSDLGMANGEDGSALLGPEGVSLAAYHTAKVRETTLVALSALASAKDEYRKAIIENGVISFIIRTLKADDIKFVATSNTETLNDEGIERKIIHGNCRDAILAACGTTRALSRSVSTLRTSLMDAGLASPLFVLLRCQDMEIKIAATAVVCNLVLEFSPMREAILEGGVLTILCDHAHAKNANLRLNSLWALKHLVVNAATDIKISCLEELGVTWLKQLISNDAEFLTTSRSSDRDEGNGTPMRMSTPNAAGEQVDLLNAVEEASRDSSGAPEKDGDEDFRMSDSVGSLNNDEGEFKPRSTPTKTRQTLRVPGNQTPQQHILDLPDEVSVVKQGLEFLRNIMLGSNIAEMVDYVLREMGQDDFFRILTSKLRPKVLNAFNRDRKSSETNGIRHIQPPAEILISTLYIIVHIAASQPRHRQLLINQRRLLEQLIHLFTHHNPEIRSACAWVVHNLTWDDDASEKPGCRERARKLTDLGFHQRLREMEDDAILDCKERAKTAMHTISTVLRS